MLGRVVEKVSGVTLGRFFSERMFGPLKMPDTAFLVPTSKVGRLAQPPAVEPSTGQPIKLVDVTVPPKNDAGGAGTAGTTGDYARFAQMLLNGGQLEGTRLLSPTTVAFMTSDPVGEYRWGGAAGTAFWVDPKDEMISVLMTQGAPGPARGYTNTLFRQMVRQAIVSRTVSVGKRPHCWQPATRNASAGRGGLYAGHGLTRTRPGWTAILLITRKGARAWREED